MYYLARRMTMMGSSGPSINAKTYLQMTSTGAFRFIRKQGIADSIAMYYQFIKSFDNWAELQRSRINNIIDVNDKLFNANVLFSIYRAIESHGDSLEEILKSNPPLMTKNPESINAVMIHYQYYYGFMKLMNNRDANASAHARRLIKLLQKEYGL